MEPETLSLSGFALKHGWHKSRSSQLKKEGRLILDSTGRVLVAESEALLFSTTDPTKAGVAERHQINRSQGMLNKARRASVDEAGDIVGISSSQRRAAATKREKKSATLEQLKRVLSQMPVTRKLRCAIEQCSHSLW